MKLRLISTLLLLLALGIGYMFFGDGQPTTSTPAATSDGIVLK